MLKRTKADNRKRMVEVFEKHREHLGDQFDALVDEINEVSYFYLLQHNALPKVRPGTLDGNALEERRLNREEAWKWVLIKQKYGI